MRYFCTKDQIEGKGTLWHEFVSGEWDERFWGEDSLYLSDELLTGSGLKKLLRENVGDYDYYGETDVLPEEWEHVTQNAEGEAAEIAAELAEWAADAFEKADCFKILGI
ncbi:MAG: hypothetical protein IJM44_02420 [Ruminococcus sp.]|nr:hypothetical protein [Ruminococcus sp.]